MTRRRLPYAATLVALAAAYVVAFALPATAAQRTVRVRTALGQVITVTVDAPCGPISASPGLPGTPIEDLTPPGECNGGGGGGGGGSSQPQQQPTQTQQQTQTQTQTSGGGGGGSKHHSGSSPSSHGGHSQHHAHSKGHAKNHNPQAGVQGGAGGKGGSHRHHGGGGGGLGGGGTPGGPPTFFDALPGPSQVTGVPNLVLNHFDIPIFLLPIYEAAGTQYGVRWEVLAAINQVETNFGRNLSVSSAGAEGWMQFMPSTWKTWGVDANGDKTRDPYNPPDAIFAAARYLKAAGAEKDIRKAIFAYNHAGWYVDGVMLRARVFAAYPPNFVGALTGLTQARFPVAARAKYKNQVGKPTSKKLKPGGNAANVVSADPSQRAIDIFAKPNAPVVAANDGVVKKVGASPSRGKYVVLQDVYGNTYTYSQLGSVQPVYPVPKNITKPNKAAAKALAANAFQQKDPTPTAPASAGTQTPNAPRAAAPPKKQRAPAKPAKRSPAAAASQVTYKARLFAHPRRANASKAGGLEQVFDRQTNNG